MELRTFQNSSDKHFNWKKVALIVILVKGRNQFQITVIIFSWIIVAAVPTVSQYQTQPNLIQFLPRAANFQINLNSDQNQQQDTLPCKINSSSFLWKAEQHWWEASPTASIFQRDARCSVLWVLQLPLLITATARVNRPEQATTLIGSFINKTLPPLLLLPLCCT